MDSIENFFEKNKDQFDYIDAKPTDWQSINEQLQAPAKSSGKLRFLWKIAASVAILLCVALYTFGPRPVATEMKELTGLELGDHFPEVALRNPDGEKVSLSDLNAHVILVDFWASYSMACNEVNCYYFKPLYNEFKDKGFEIYAVSADSSAASWVNAIERDQLDWVQVSDLKGFDSPLMETYKVDALPTNYLLDEAGRIIAKNINVYELEDTLYHMLAFH